MTCRGGVKTADLIRYIWNVSWATFYTNFIYGMFSLPPYSFFVSHRNDIDDYKSPKSALLRVVDFHLQVFDVGDSQPGVFRVWGSCGSQEVLKKK